MPKVNLTLDTHNQVILNGASQIKVSPEVVLSLTRAVEEQAIAESASAGLALVPPPQSTTAPVPSPSLLRLDSIAPMAPTDGASDGTGIPAEQLSAVHADIAKYLTDER